jgi:hypothetical protein
VAKDNGLFARQAATILLKTSAEMVALVPAESIYPGEKPPNPAWPFLGFGQPITAPFTASGLDGSTTSFVLHGYARTTGEGEATIPGEDMVAAMLRVAVAVLGGEDGAQVSLEGTDCPYPATAFITWTGTQIMQAGGEAGAFHGISSFDVTVTS